MLIASRSAARMRLGLARRLARQSSSPPNGVGRAPNSLWVWGKVDDSRLGVSLGDQKFGATALAMGPAVGPTYNANLRGVTQVVCAASKTLALTTDGSVYSWGTCRTLSLGHGAGVESVARPRKIEALAGIKIVQVAAGETASAAVSSEGEVFTWGWGGSFWEGAASSSSAPEFRDDLRLLAL